MRPVSTFVRDALGCSVSRNADSFAYNARGEVDVEFAIGRFFDL